MTTAIVVEELQKAYGPIRAADGISFEVQQGEIFGMVGPNGAGKTTTIECIEGLRKADSGRISLLGKDPRKQRIDLAERIGIQLQESALPSRLRVVEAMTLFRSFYSIQADVDELLDRLGLQEKRSTPFSKLSGGQKRRLFIALALINRPDVVFLDELTTGLDPQARRAMWDLVRQIREQGRTVFLTTHFMEEAERLCDRVAILDRGRILALDTPEGLIRSLGKEKRLLFKADGQDPRPVLADLPGVSQVERSGERTIVHGGGDHFAGNVINALEEAGINFNDFRTQQPTLDDVFLAMTGRAMRE